MELQQYWRVVQKRLWLIALLIVAGAALAGYTSLREKPVYESSATLVLNPAVPAGMVIYVQNQVASNLADSYTALMHTQLFGERVAKELNNGTSPGSVVGSITTQLKPNTLFFFVSGRADSPEKSQQLVNAVVKVFLTMNADQQKQVSDQTQGTTRSDMQIRLQDQLNYLDALEKSYQDRIKNLESESITDNRTSEILQLRGQLIELQSARTTVIGTLANIQSSAAPTNTAIVVDPALPGYQLASKWQATLLTSILGAAVVGIAIAFVLDYMDYTVRSPEYLEQMMGLTPMAVVGMVGANPGVAYYGSKGRRKRRTSAKPSSSTNWAGRLAGRKLVTLEFPKSPDSESFRVLRTNIQFFSLGKPVRSLVVTSAGPGEGKSFTAANLAIVMAQAGKRVILVDTDLRRPSIHKLFDLPNTVGFTNLVLNNMADRGTIIQQVEEVPNLLIVTSGPLPPNPSELLDSPQAQYVINALAQTADLVIYDTPPATAVTDPAIMATRVDGVVLVINAATTRRDMVERVRRILQNVGVKSLIPVLNQVRVGELRGYYYYNTYGNTIDVPVSALTGNGHHGNGHHGNGHQTGSSGLSAVAVDDVLSPKNEE